MQNLNENTTTIISGDFNINLINTLNRYVEEYTNIVLQNSFIPCISIPSRITHHSASIIDHILLKTPKNLIHTKVSAGNLIADISDHLPNILFIDLIQPKIKDRPLIRLLTPNKITEYLDKIKQIKSLISYQNKSNIDDNDPQNTYNELDSNLQKLLNKYFPLVKQSRKQFKDKPFITSGIKESIKSRNTLFKIYQNNWSEINERNWKNKRNRVVEILRIAEAEHNASFIKNHGDNSRQLWKRFGDVLGKPKTNNSPIMELISQNQKITNPGEITSEFNKDFISLGEKLYNQIKKSDSSHFKRMLVPHF